MSIFQPIPFGTPPFIPTSVPVLPPVTSVPTPTTGPAQMVPSPSMPGNYIQGPFCFGLDKLICANLPETIPLRFGLSIPSWEICKAITNLLCIVLVLSLLAGIIYLGVYGLVLGEGRQVLRG